VSSNEQNASASEPRHAVRVAMAPDGQDFNDLLRAGGAVRIVELLDSARPLPSFMVAESNASPKPPGKRRRANANGGGTAPGGAGQHAGADPTGAAGVPANGSDSNEPPDGPRAFGYDVEALNREYSLVKVGSQAVIFQESPSARLPDQLRAQSIDTFKIWMRNKPTEIQVRGRIRRVTYATRWLDDPKRRQYEGIEFFPDPDNKSDNPNYLNLWRGFAVKPAEQPDSQRYKTFRDHLLNNVCNGDKGLFDYVFGFFAHMMQRPRERIGVALVLRGKMGTGKTKVGEVIGSLIPRHWCLVDSPRYVTGNFNAHMPSCLLLQADEAMFAGDKEVLGRLKGLITAPTQFIEAKGVDPVPFTNYIRLILTSNEDWVVPAGKDERRFLVLDVNPQCAQNHDYFREMEEELAAGGLEHLLADLLRFDLTKDDLRKIPLTSALLEQKIRSLDPIESWWFDRLMAGATTRNGDKWLNEVPRAALYGDYIAASEQIGVRRKQPESVFGTKLKDLVPSLGYSRPRMTIEVERGILKDQRVRCYVLPSLAIARADFERLVGQQVAWPQDIEPPADSSVEKSDIVDL
jgi:hypothetical protein